MALYYSINPVVNNPVLVKDQDINLLQYVLTIPKMLVNGINLIDKADFPALAPNEIQSEILGAPFTNMVIQPVFVSKRSKNRGSYYLSVIASGIGTEYFIEVAPQGEFTTVSLFTDFTIDEIKVGNLTEDGISCTLLYGQGSLITPPTVPIGSVTISNFKDFVNALIINNKQLNNKQFVVETIRPICGPNQTP